MSPVMVLAGLVIVVLLLVGLDLLFGAKGLARASGVFNRRVDVDSAVIKGLSELRLKGEKEIVRIDEKALQGRLRIFLAILLLTPACMLFFVIFLRK